MEQNLDKPGQKELDVWIKKNLNAAVHKLMDKGKIDSLVVEARPAWVLPFQILIGKIRAKDQSGDFEWFISGEVPTDYLEATAAETPRDAARHFSMKWQLTASRYQGKGTDQDSSQIQHDEVVNNLISQSEALYALVEDDRVWLQKNNP